jgi:pimeloyl-ACP methyl ester carboxylesterase
LIPALQAEGHEAVSAQNGLDSLRGDVAAVTRALGRVKSPAILVGLSYCGTVITAAGMDERVVGLVYIAALAPDEGETSQSLINEFPTTDIFAHIEVAEGRIWPGVAWKSKPSWYIVGKKDRTVQPDLQRKLAKRMKATTHELETSHLPMLSQPKLVVDVIRAAASAPCTSAKRNDSVCANDLVFGTAWGRRVDAELTLSRPGS